MILKKVQIQFYSKVTIKLMTAIHWFVKMVIKHKIHLRMHKKQHGLKRKFQSVLVHEKKQKECETVNIFELVMNKYIY
jgi:hypothetical protein